MDWIGKQRYRLLVLGSSRVGKTSLIKRYLQSTYSDRYKETVEDIYPRDFHIHGSLLPLDIYDTNYHYPDMRRVSISSADAFLLVFAVDDVNSFKSVADLVQEVAERRQVDIDELPVVLVGNKADTDDKKIYPETVRHWLKNLTLISKSVPYYETSAKTGDNTVAVFKSLLDQSGFPNRMRTPREAISRRRTFQQSRVSTSIACSPGACQETKRVGMSKPPPRRQSSQVTVRCLSAGRHGSNSDEEEKPVKEKEKEKGKEKRMSRFTRALSINRDKLVPSLVTTPTLLVHPQSQLNGDMKTLVNTKGSLTRHGSLMKKPHTPRLSLKMKRVTMDEPDESDCRIS